MERQKGLIESLLPSGEANAIHGEDLIRQYDISNTRILRAMVEKERRQGAIIASSDKGYFIPETREEVQRFIASRRKAALTTLISISAARKALEHDYPDEAAQMDIESYIRDLEKKGASDG